MKTILFLSLCAFAFAQNLLAYNDSDYHQDNFSHKQKQSLNISYKLNETNSNYCNMKYLRVGPGAISGYSIPAYPTIGFGKRVQKSKHHGYDFSMDIHSVILINFLSLKGQYMYFFNESPQKQFYLGSGFNFESPCHILLPVELKSISLEVTPGIQYKTQTGKIRFLQLDISQPLYMNHNSFEKHYHHFPVVGLSYGFGF